MAVLWLSAVLSAIALTVSTSVRGETERTSTAVDGTRAYYVATGGIDRALLWILWGPKFRNPDGTSLYFQSPMPRLHFEFPAGVADVEVIPESSKLDINRAPPEQLLALMAALGVPGGDMIVQGIVDWRSPTPGGAFTDFDQHYLSISPTFRARHASFEEIEELLLVRGVTPELFYGSYQPGPDGRLLPRPGLRDCLSIYSTPGVIDVNSVQPAVMQALGIPPDAAAQIVAMRRRAPFRLPDQLANLPAGSAGRLGFGTSAVITLRATASARLPNGRLSDMRRSVSALIAFLGEQYTPSYHILRWYDNAVVVQ